MWFAQVKRLGIWAFRAKLVSRVPGTSLAKGMAGIGFRD